MKRLLTSQVELSALLDPSHRLNATFLGELSLAKSKLPILPAALLEEIDTVRIYTFTIHNF